MLTVCGLAGKAVGGRDCRKDNNKKPLGKVGGKWGREPETEADIDGAESLPHTPGQTLPCAGWCGLVISAALSSSLPATFPAPPDTQKLKGGHPALEGHWEPAAL